MTERLLKNVFQDLSEKIENRTSGLSVAVRALEEIRAVVIRNRPEWTDREHLLFVLCDRALEQIAQIEKIGD